MSKDTVEYWLENVKNIPVHYFYQDEERTIKEICSAYDGETGRLLEVGVDGEPQVHMFVATKRPTGASPIAYD